MSGQRVRLRETTKASVIRLEYLHLDQARPTHLRPGIPRGRCLKIQRGLGGIYGEDQEERQKMAD